MLDHTEILVLGEKQQKNNCLWGAPQAFFFVKVGKLYKQHAFWFEAPVTIKDMEFWGPTLASMSTINEASFWPSTFNANFAIVP